MKKIIKLENVCKEYNNSENCVLSDINLEIEEGEMIAIIGTSGSGKSTLLNCIGLELAISNGKYELDGNDVSKLKEKELARYRNEYFGYVMQDFALIPGMSVYDNVILPLVYSKKKYSNAEKIDLCKEKLEFVGVEEKMHDDILQLSGGQKQRVAIARALVADQKIIIADEPTGALDSKTTNSIMDLFGELNKKGKTIIIVTHDMDVAKRCNKIYSILDGKIKLTENFN